MADVTVKHIDDLDSHEGRGTFMFARKGLGVTSFGMNVRALARRVLGLSGPRPREGRAGRGLLRRGGLGDTPGGR